MSEAARFPNAMVTRAGAPADPGRLHELLQLDATGNPLTLAYHTIPSISESVERKYDLLARSVEHGTWHTHHDSFLFLAKDAAVPDTLRFYKRACQDRGASLAQLDGISRLIERVETFQAAHPELVKVADVEVAFAPTISGPNAA